MNNLTAYLGQKSYLQAGVQLFHEYEKLDFPVNQVRG